MSDTNSVKQHPLGLGSAVDPRRAPDTRATAGLMFALPLMNVLLGWVHRLLFEAFFMLMFD